MKREFRFSPRAAVVIFLSLLVLCNPDETLPRTNRVPYSLVKVRPDLRAAKKLASELVSRFYKTGDIGEAFGDRWVSNFGSHLVHSRFFDGLNFDAQVASQLSEENKRRVYEKFMTFVYLKLAYELRQPSNRPDAPIGCKDLPSTTCTKLENMRFRSIFDASANDSEVLVKSRTDVDEFMRELSDLDSSLRSNLPNLVSRDLGYQQRLDEMVRNRDVGSYTRTGYPELGIKNNKIFIVGDDLFIFAFMWQKGELKLLSLVPE